MISNWLTALPDDYADFRTFMEAVPVLSRLMELEPLVLDMVESATTAQELGYGLANSQLLVHLIIMREVSRSIEVTFDLDQEAPQHEA